MDTIEAIILGIVQGLTEFLPVSSSGHLQIAKALMGVEIEQNLLFDVTLHAATVLSTIVVLWSEVARLLRGLFSRRFNEEQAYVLKLLLSMIPIGIVGFTLKDRLDALLESPAILLVVGCMLLVTAALLAFAYYAKPRQKAQLSYRDAFLIGVAQAVAALAYGTETIRPVAKITGPGNAFVAAAKKLVSGDVGIDMIAGPSEVCVVADETADPRLVAIDLMAQAEHDPLAACYLVTFSDAYADAVEAAIQVHLADSTRADITRTSLDDHGLIVVCTSMDQALEAVNVIAPEHLEMHVEGAMEYLGAIRNAGAIFLGAWTPEAVGDYVAGPNHTLPTGGTAMFSSPLSVDDFVKRSSVICYTPQGLMNDAPATQAMARREGLWAHALSAGLRRRVLQQGEGSVSADALQGEDLTAVAWPDDEAAVVMRGAALDAAARMDKKA